VRSWNDTAVASYLLRGSSPNWNDLRRRYVDFYDEGALLWLDADTLIRTKTGGKKSLDDFCRKFLGANPSHARVVPYELPEILAMLRELADFDWDAFFARRISQPLDALPLEVVGRCGYRLRYATEPSDISATRNAGTSRPRFVWAELRRRGSISTSYPA
jgi:predicted metalloprotease with PDZ domain